MLDVRRLQVLTAVVRTGSITAAAPLLGYTPSAVSQSVAALQRQTGVVLLERSGRGVRPTQAGRLLAEHAEHVIERLQQAEAALDALRAGEAGRLRLAAFATAGATLVPSALARFRAIRPAVDLHLTIAETGHALQRLRAGEIDLAVVAADEWEPEPTGDDLAQTHLLDDPYLVVVPRTHPMAGRRSIALADLAADRWVVTASAHCNSRALITSACTTAGFTPRFAIEADEFATALGFVNAALGVTLLPLLALSSVPDGARARRVRGVAPARRVSAVTRRALQREPSVREMVDALRDSAHSYPASAR